jgi:hypothetical protein
MMLMGLFLVGFVINQDHDEGRQDDVEDDEELGFVHVSS